ncbi:AraC family transcriptional regulator [Enterobacterales bacterium CwR94]|nr:AraC family transcriptional regulator [Enterobacterales bacterium CwR94]
MQKDLRPEDMTHFGLNIYQFGHQRCAPKHSFGPAVRQHFLLHYVIQGKGCLYTEQGQWPLAAGEAFLIHPHAITTYTADARQPWEYMWIEVDGLIAERSFEACGLLREAPVWRAKSADASAQALLSEILTQDTSRALKIAGLTCQFLDALMEHGLQQPKPVNSENRHLENAVAYMERHYHNPLDILAVAKHCRIDRSYLTRLFQKQLGIGPKQYLLRLRMTMAVGLLQDLRLPIKVIACSVGYADQMQFSRLFRQHFHMSPSEWRARHPLSHEIIELAPVTRPRFPLPPPATE